MHQRFPRSWFFSTMEENIGGRPITPLTDLGDSPMERYDEAEYAPSPLKVAKKKRKRNEGTGSDGTIAKLPRQKKRKVPEIFSGNGKDEFGGFCLN